MKKNVILLTLFVTAFALYSCSSSTEDGSGEKSAKSKKSNETEIQAVCIWDRVALREEASEKGKWLTSVNLGERVTFLNETTVDTSGNRPIEYYKLALLDGKQGWVRGDFIVIDAKPAVFINDANYYNRPDMMTKSNNAFSMMDIVAVKGEQDGWIEVVGKRSAGTWIESGWVRPDNISYDDIDLAVAKFSQAAMAIKDDQKKAEAIQEIVDNPDLKNSIFVPGLIDRILEITKIEEDYDDFVEEEVDDFY